MTFFFDNNLSQKLVKALQAIGEDVIHLQEKFSEETKDVEWLEYIGKNKMFLVSSDKRITRRPNELQMLRQSNVGAFILRNAKLSHCQIVQQLVRSWPEIKLRAAKEHRPFVFTVRPKGGKLERLSL